MTIMEWKVIYRYLDDKTSWTSVFFSTEDLAWDFIQSLDSNFDYELPIRFMRTK